MDMGRGVKRSRSRILRETVIREEERADDETDDWGWEREFGRRAGKTLDDRGREREFEPRAEKTLKSRMEPDSLDKTVEEQVFGRQHRPGPALTSEVIKRESSAPQWTNWREVAERVNRMDDETLDYEDFVPLAASSFSEPGPVRTVTVSSQRPQPGSRSMTVSSQRPPPAGRSMTVSSQRPPPAGRSMTVSSQRPSPVGGRSMNYASQRPQPVDRSINISSFNPPMSSTAYSVRSPTTTRAAQGRHFIPAGVSRGGTSGMYPVPASSVYPAVTQYRLPVDDFLGAKSVRVPPQNVAQPSYGRNVDSATVAEIENMLKELKGRVNRMEDTINASMADRSIGAANERKKQRFEPVFKDEEELLGCLLNIAALKKQILEVNRKVQDMSRSGNKSSKRPGVASYSGRTSRMPREDDDISDDDDDIDDDDSDERSYTALLTSMQDTFNSTRCGDMN